MCVKTAGFAYQTATNGLDALEKFKANDFDAVVMGQFAFRKCGFPIR